MRYRSACAKLFEFHSRNALKLTEKTRSSLARGAAAAIATAQSMTSLKEGQASAFEHDQSVCIEKELLKIKQRTKDDEIMVKNRATNSIMKAKQIYAARNEKKLKKIQASSRKIQEELSISSSTLSSNLSPTLNSLNSLNSLVSLASTNSDSPTPMFAAAPTAALSTTTLVKSIFGSGSFGIELGGLSAEMGGGVVLVDMEKGGQACNFFPNRMAVGMKLMKVNDIDVSIYNFYCLVTFKCFVLNVFLTFYNFKKYRYHNLHWTR